MRRSWRGSAVRRNDGSVLIDMHSITSFGGSPDGFVDGTRMLPGNLEKLVATVLREDHGALQVLPAAGAAGASGFGHQGWSRSISPTRSRTVRWAFGWSGASFRSATTR